MHPLPNHLNSNNLCFRRSGRIVPAPEYSADRSDEAVAISNPAPASLARPDLGLPGGDLAANTTPIKRGGESRQHERIKLWVAQQMKAAAFELVLFEAHNCDVSGCKIINGQPFIFAAEIELSAKHVLENAWRDFASGAHYLTIVTPNERVRRQVERKLQKYLPAELRSKITLTTAPPANI